MKPKIFTTLQTYDLRQFQADLFAGITVAMVAVPLSIAIAIASNAPPVTGLVTAVVAGFIISAFGGSRVQIGGPTGAFIVVVYGVIEVHGFDGLLIASVMAGVMLLLAGFMRAGRLMRFVPGSVISGFTIGIAIIIASSQIKDFLGMSVVSVPADFVAKIETLWHARHTVQLPSLVIGITTVALIAILRRLFPKVPGLIVAVGLVSVASSLLSLPVDTIVSRYGELPRGLPWPQIPELSMDKVKEVLPSAFIIAFLAGIESLLSAAVADKLISGNYRPNAELLAQGLANIASPLFGGLPATGAIARTATNIRAGGKTPVAGIVHALIVLVVMMFAAPVVSHLTMPALAGVLILTAWNMSEPSAWHRYFSAPISDRILLVLTMVLTVVADLTFAIATGIGLGILLRLWQGDARA